MVYKLAIYGIFDLLKFLFFGGGLINIIEGWGVFLFNPKVWSCIVSSDCSQQRDGCSCVVFVILNVASILLGYQIMNLTDIKKVSLLDSSCSNKVQNWRFKYGQTSKL